jgi:hypothetical protein
MVIINKALLDDEVFEKFLITAKNILKAGERAVRFTQRALNSSYEAMGFNQALKSSIYLEVLLNIAPDLIKEKFAQARKDRGLAAAIEWRDKRFIQTY